MASLGRLAADAGRSFQELRRRLEGYMASETPRLFRGIEEEVGYALAGGKRVRGVLTLYVAEIFGVEGAESLAYAIELMHSASLVHDDIVDKTLKRRGVESLWAKYGMGDAVTLPHLMISRAVELISAAGVEAVRDSMDAWYRAAMGQMWDTWLLEGRRVDASYLDIVAAKTGAVFEAAAFLPFHAGGRHGLVDMAKRFGGLLGTVYQVIDDLASLDETPDSGSLIALERDSGGDPEGYAFRLLSELIPEMMSSARELSPRLAGFAAYTIRVFLEEAGGRAARLVREASGGALP